MIEFGIVGLGPWGLSVLERTVSHARRTGAGARVHVVEPGPPGGGTYRDVQSDYLVLNNACGQLSLYASPETGQDPPYGLGLYEWAVRTGYAWFGYECRREAGGQPITPGDYLPRRLMGEYLRWFYSTLVDAAPPCVDVIHHPTRAIDITPLTGGRERISLEVGQPITVDHVVLTSGHTENQEPGGLRAIYRQPYPVERLARELPAGTTLAVAGMGLVAYDLMAAMTIGRGGAFVDDGDRLRYLPSGHEARVQLFSRSGMPYSAKSVASIDPDGVYPLIVCTPDWFRAIRGPDGSRKVDFMAQVMPGLYDEMRCRYDLHAATLAGGDPERHVVAGRLAAAQAAGRLDAELGLLEGRYGAFDPTTRFLPTQHDSYAGRQEYQAEVYQRVADDLDHAIAPGGSPVKAALEMTRVLRDELRTVIEFGRLTADSYIEFQTHIHSGINSVEAGPPAMRSQQLLALLDAGVVETPFGPSPAVQGTPDGGVELRSTRFEAPYSATAGSLVRGYLDMPRLVHSASPLLRNLGAAGRLTQLHYGTRAVGSVAITESFHPLSDAGREQTSLSLLGVLTEGVRYFTHYLPSPKSRLRAVQDAQTCVEEIFA